MEDKNTIVTATGVWFIISAVLGICAGLALMGLGAFAGALGAGGAAAITESGGLTERETAEAAAAIAAAGGLGALSAVIGIAVLVVAIASLVVAIGLFQKKPWSHRAVLILTGVSVVLGLLQLLTGNFVQIVFLAINAIIFYLFYSDAGIKRVLGVV